MEEASTKTIKRRIINFCSICSSSQIYRLLYTKKAKK